MQEFFAHISLIIHIFILILFFSELVKNRIKIYWLADFFNYSILLADILLKF